MNRDDTLGLTYQSNHEYKTSQFFKKTKFTLININFRFKTRTKQILVIFWARLGKSLIWQKSSATWEPDFDNNVFLENAN